MKGKAVHYREVAYEQKAGEPRGSKAINPREPQSLHSRSFSLFCFLFHFEPSEKGQGARFGINQVKTLINLLVSSSFSVPLSFLRRSFFHSLFQGSIGMYPSKTFSIIGLAAILVQARPAPQVSRGLFDDVSITDDLIIFYSPAFPDPTNPANTIVALQSFVSLRSVDLGVVATAFTAALSALGIDVGDGINLLQQRVKLIGAIGLPGKAAEITVPGCSSSIVTGESSSFPDLGLASKRQSLGKCSGGKELTATAKLGILDSRKISGSIFSSPDSGFGVISGERIPLRHTLQGLTNGQTSTIRSRYPTFSTKSPCSNPPSSKSLNPFPGCQNSIPPFPSR